MAALDFPNTPAVNDKWPQPPVPGTPVYTWDGAVWTTIGGAVGSTGASDAVPVADSGVGGSGSSTLWSRGDHFHPANTASPVFTGNPQAPTPAAGDNDTSIATTAFVHSEAILKTGGGTIRGSLIISENTPFLQVRKDVAPAAGNASIGGSCGTAMRWNVVLGNGTTEGGGNSGSNFSIDRYSDAGGNLGSALTINRQSGAVGVVQDFSVGGNTTLNALNAGAIYTGGNVTAGNALVYGSNSDYVTGNASTTTMLVNGVNNYWTYTKPSGYWQWFVNSTQIAQFQFPAGFAVFGPAYKPGGGAWGDSSDERIKTVTGNYTAGLDAITQLQPVTFHFKGNDTMQPPDHNADAEGNKPTDPVTVPYPNSPHYGSAVAGKLFHGLIAQEVAAVLPEMVTTREGYIDGNKVTDLHDIDTTPLIYALINSIKELKARIEVLEGA